MVCFCLQPDKAKSTVTENAAAKPISSAIDDDKDGRQFRSSTPLSTFSTYSTKSADTKASRQSKLKDASEKSGKVLYVSVLQMLEQVVIIVRTRYRNYSLNSH